MYDLSPRVPKVIIQVHSESFYLRGRKLPPLLSKIPCERVRRTQVVLLGTVSLALGKHLCPLPHGLRGAAERRAHPPQWTQVWPILNFTFPETEIQMLRERETFSWLGCQSRAAIPELRAAVSTAHRGVEGRPSCRRQACGSQRSESRRRSRKIGLGRGEEEK